MVQSGLESKAYICLGQAEVVPQLELSIYTVTCLSMLMGVGMDGVLERHVLVHQEKGDCG